jgi:hypothetical protein
MHYLDILHSEGLREFWIRAGVVGKRIYIPVHILAPRIGKELWYLLPLVHTLTGCDCTSKAGTNHAALNCTDEFVASCETYLVQVLK